MKRVSARRENLNSFQKRVPTGNFHASGSDASTWVPAGSSIQRVLTAPSVHRGYCGEKRIFAAPTSLVFQSVYRPVSRRLSGGHVSDGDCPAVANGNTRATTASNSRFMRARLIWSAERIARLAA